ncbi:putative Clp domain superfamily protein [Helianthus annuus]|uniref:Clp domain superfamily protein n=1 Tax=Helianthus annuus TaxID=4232 RepID=A0A251UE60_HELAN|nr:ATP-dependent Clp protease ATP-binding subunit CLPT1, chloroplastic [Helianthus annuus]KAF5800449.1 putative Clp domain superfamily protein [Helianthus annuus]
MATQSLSLLHISPSSSSSGYRNSHNSPLFTPTVRSSIGLQFSIQPLSYRSKTSGRYSSIVATVSSTPAAPTPEKAAPEKSAKWSFRFIKSFAMGELEARKLKYNNTGTESLLLGILVEGTSLAAKLLRESGVTLFKVRDETVNLLGKSDMYIFSPEHPPLTKAAQKAIDWAINEKLKSGETGEVTTSHLLLGIWAQKESAGYKIMAKLGFDDDKAKELAKTMDKEIILSYKKGV